MTISELTAQAIQHQAQMVYEIGNWRRAMEVGSLNSAERSLATAAQHAAILTALRPMLGEPAPANG